MSLFFTFAIVGAVIGLFTALNRPTRYRRYYDPKDTDPWYDADDDDFQHVPPQGFQQQPFQPQYPYGAQQYYPNPYPPQPNPYYSQQLYAPYPPPPYGAPPYYRSRYQNNWSGVSTGALMGMMATFFLVFMFWFFSGKDGTTISPSINRGGETHGAGSSHIPLLKEDVYILWLRECLDEDDAHLIHKELRRVLNDKNISLLHMGATTDLCVYAKSKRDAESLLSFWQQYRSSETKTYDLKPKVINLRDWCTRLMMDPSATEIHCGEK